MIALCSQLYESQKIYLCKARRLMIPYFHSDSDKNQVNCSRSAFEKNYQVVDLIVFNKSPSIPFRKGDLRRLERLTWLVGRTKERTTEQCSYR